MGHSTPLFVGLDVHKDSIAVAHAQGQSSVRRLVARGKHPNVAVTAIARELIAFMWAIAKEVPINA